MAKIDTSRIAGYADMSLEDKLKALEAFEYNDNASELESRKRQFPRQIPRPQSGKGNTMLC